MELIKYFWIVVIALAVIHGFLSAARKGERKVASASAPATTTAVGTGSVASQATSTAEEPMDALELARQLETDTHCSARLMIFPTQNHEDWRNEEQ